MKYKNICAAIHNFAHSFVSWNNYVDGGYVVDDLSEIHTKGNAIDIDWLKLKFEPSSQATDRIQKSISYYAAWLPDIFSSSNIEIQKLTALNFRWPLNEDKFIEATDDRGKVYRMPIKGTN